MTVALGNKSSLSISKWQSATWEDYEGIRDDRSIDRVQLFFFNNQLLLENMGWEGINHARVRELFSIIFYLWFSEFSEQTATLMGGCLLEKKGMQAAAPDLVVYVGKDVPTYQEGNSRSIDLNQHRVPDLVGEVADTTLVSDMREKADLYAELKIPEYWVIDVKGRRVFAFNLSEAGAYFEVESSQVLSGLKISLLNQALENLSVSNVEAATRFLQQVKQEQLS